MGEEEVQRIFDGHRLVRLFTWRYARRLDDEQKQVLGDLVVGRYLNEGGQEDNRTFWQWLWDHREEILALILEIIALFV